MKVLKFGAIWCAGCLVMKPRWQKIEKEYPWFESEYFEYDISPKAVAQYHVENTTLPTVIFLDNYGKEITRETGEIPKDELVKIILENKDK